MFTKLHPRTIKALTEKFHYIKIGENTYIFFGKISDLPKALYEELLESLKYLWKFISSPFLFVFSILKMFRCLLPVIVQSENIKIKEKIQ